MDIRKLGFKTTMISFLVSAALMLSTCMVYARDSCQLIKISKEKAGGGSSVQIFPEKVTVPVGTCTVWINFVKDTEVRVGFRENAKQCILSSGASTGFVELELKIGEVCYLSETFPHGNTASIFWSKPGIYKYTLETPMGKDYEGNIIAEGVIEVK